jgi:hypothetical protein
MSAFGVTGRPQIDRERMDIRIESVTAEGWTLDRTS